MDASRSYVYTTTDGGKQVLRINHYGYVRQQPVGGGGVLPDEDGALEREGQEDWVCAAEHGADQQLRHRPEVRSCFVGRGAELAWKACGG